MKTCTKCNSTKSINDFSKDKSKKDGYRPDCRVCKNKANTAYHRTKAGIVTSMYGSQIYASKKRGYAMPNYSKEELREWLFSQTLFYELFSNWVDSGFIKNLTPSCDRHNETGDYDYLPYTLDLIRLCTWKENMEKGFHDKRNGINNKTSKVVLQYSKDMVLIKKHKSIRGAARELGLKDANIVVCCKNINRTAHGFYWRYSIEHLF